MQSLSADLSGSGKRLSSPQTVTTAVLLALSACASVPPGSCRVGSTSEVQDTLFFGVGKPHGAVSGDEWSRFLETVVTPRFPQGLTVTEATGQWLSANGTLTHESSHVLMVVHPESAADDTHLAQIITAYKGEFQQEAVLRVTARVCVSF